MSMWILSNNNHKKYSNKHVWRLKFKQGTRELFVVCVICSHKEKVTWYSDYQEQVLSKEFLI